jgi:hypothetical protein
VTDGAEIELPLVGQVWVDDGRMRFRDPQVRADVALHLVTLAPHGEPDAVAFAGGGSLHGEKFRIAGQAEELGALREVAQPFPLIFHAKTGATDAWFDGAVVPRDPENMRGFLKVAGPDMAQLYPLLPTAIPWTPPYALKGQLVHRQGLWQVSSLSGKMGQSDLAGTVTIETARPRRRVVADLSSQRLDYRDLGGFLGLPPGKAEVRAQATGTASRRQARRQHDRVFSEQPFQLERLREFDGELRFRGKSVRVDRVPMDNVEMHIVVDNGVLRYDPVKLGIADGQLVITGTLDANQDAPRLDAKLEGATSTSRASCPELASPRGKADASAATSRYAEAARRLRAIAAHADGEGALSCRAARRARSRCF